MSTPPFSSAPDTPDVPNKPLVALLSSGIDSPVAAAILLERGCDLVALHCDNRPYTDDRQLAKVRRLIQRLEAIAGHDIAAYTLPHGRILQSAIAAHCDPHVQCLLCKRMMLREAERLARRLGAVAIVTGDNLGQVASQTLQNIAVVSSAVTSLPILRPLIAYDKNEIVNRARVLGTFERSIAPDAGCTAVPTKPSTAAQYERIAREEAKLDIDALIAQTLAALEPLEPLTPLG